jgi:hypothetical protein
MSFAPESATERSVEGRAAVLCFDEVGGSRPRILDPAATVPSEGEIYTVALARIGFLDHGGEQFQEEIVKSPYPCVPEVHPWPPPDVLTASQHLDLVGGIDPWGIRRRWRGWWRGRGEFFTTASQRASPIS